jgi:dihydrolipoamide dehydrogenase
MYDLIILGAGPGGYVAAERAGERGKKVLLIEKAEIGGVCLNEGCIPTKTLLNSAKHYSHALDSKMFGVHTENATFNLEEAQIWKNKVIDTNRKGILYLMDKYKVEIVKGTGVFNNNGTIQVGDTSYSGKDIIIATGSSPFMPPIPGADSSSVLDSTDLLEITKVPSSLVVIGGGVIGLEFASFFSMLGVKVDIIEMMDEIAPFMEPEFAKNMRRAMKKVKFHLGSKVEYLCYR